MARSYSQLKELAVAVNQNLARIGVTEKFIVGSSGSPKSYSIHNATKHLACSGKLSECMSFLYGINWLVSNNLYKPYQAQKQLEVCENSNSIRFDSFRFGK